MLSGLTEATDVLFSSLAHKGGKNQKDYYANEKKKLNA